MKQVKENYRKIRNAFRFLLGNLRDYTPSSNVELTGIHLLFKERFNNLIFRVLKSYDNLEFFGVIRLVNAFISELSSYYFSLAKDVIYIELDSDSNKQQMLANFYSFCTELPKLLAPILPVTMEEVFQHFKGSSREDSIHLERMPISPREIELIEERR